MSSMNSSIQALFKPPPAPERGLVLAVEKSPLWLKGQFSCGEQAGEMLSEVPTISSPPPSPAAQCRGCACHQQLPHTPPSSWKLEEGNVCTMLALFLLWLEELGKGRAACLERENRRLKESPSFSFRWLHYVLVSGVAWFVQQTLPGQAKSHCAYKKWAQLQAFLIQKTCMGKDTV